MASSTDPVMWVKSGHPGQFRVPRVWDEAKGRYVRPVDDFGQPLRERVPAKGFVGRDLTNMRPMPGSRAVSYLNAAGNIVDIVLSPAASLPARDDETKADRIRKQRYYGGIPVGACPCAEVFRGMPKARLISEEARNGTPCNEALLGVDEDGQPQPPCPHFLAEQKARRALQHGKNAEQNSKHRDADDKRADAMSLLAASSAEQAKAITSLASVLAPATPEPPPPAPPTGKREGSAAK